MVITRSKTDKETEDQVLKLNKTEKFKNKPMNNAINKKLLKYSKRPF